MRNDTLIYIRVYRETVPEFSTDQMYVRTPIVFPQMQLELFDTFELNREADEIRVANGHLPCYGNIKKWGVQELDHDGYYRFFATLYGVWPGCENCIEAHYVGGHGEIEEFKIELSDDQRLALFVMLNEQCWNVFEGSAVRLMREYAKEIGLNWNAMMTE